MECAYNLYHHAIALLTTGLVLLFLCCGSVTVIYIKTRPHSSSSPVQQEGQESLDLVLDEAQDLRNEIEFTHHYVTGLIMVLFIPFVTTGLIGLPIFLCAIFPLTDTAAALAKYSLGWPLTITKFNL